MGSLMLLQRLLRKIPGWVFGVGAALCFGIGIGMFIDSFGGLFLVPGFDDYWCKPMTRTQSGVLLPGFCRWSNHHVRGICCALAVLCAIVLWPERGKPNR
jgi:hypothetical protein